MVWMPGAIYPVAHTYPVPLATTLYDRSGVEDIVPPCGIQDAPISDISYVRACVRFVAGPSRHTVSRFSMTTYTTPDLYSYIKHTRRQLRLL